MPSSCGHILLVLLASPCREHIRTIIWKYTSLFYFFGAKKSFIWKYVTKDLGEKYPNIGFVEFS
jgi:hypothetical protein